jgi:hypothetical protein
MTSRKSAAHQLGDRFSVPLPPPLRKGSSIGKHDVKRSQ